MNFQALLALNLVGILAWASAPARVIGIAKANGSFRVDNSRVAGNTTLSDGATVETGEATSRLQLQKGTRVESDRGSQPAHRHRGSEFGGARAPGR